MQKLVVHESELSGLVLSATLTFCVALKTALLSHIVVYYYLFEKTQEAHSFIHAQYIPPIPMSLRLERKCDDIHNDSPLLLQSGTSHANSRQLSGCLE